MVMSNETKFWANNVSVESQFGWDAKSNEHRLFLSLEQDETKIECSLDIHSAQSLRAVLVTYIDGEIVRLLKQSLTKQ